MTDSEIRLMGDPVLRLVAKPVKRVNRSIRKTIDDMLLVMRDKNGAGLAAPQIGISKRIIIVDVGEGPYFLVNPEIISASEELQVGTEGCLSLPGYVGEVARAQRVCVKALDRDGHEVWVEGEGFLARALQHEIDHLNGVLYVDRATHVEEIVEEEASEEETPEGETPEEKTSLTPPSVVFMGCPSFAVASLDGLRNAGMNPILVITAPDKRQGRKQELVATPVKERALALGIPILTPDRVSDREVVAKIADLSPDFLVISAYGQRLSQELLAVPKIACLNVHPSLLPRYRGGNPIQRAIMEGEEVTGVSIMHVAKKMDSGDIALQKTVEIGPNETYGTLEERLSSVGAHALVEAMILAWAGMGTRTPQDDAEATYAKHLGRGEEVIDWSMTRVQIHNKVRGLSPRPGATTFWGGKRIKVWESMLGPDLGVKGVVPGTVVKSVGESLAVVCGDGTLYLNEVQPEGKRPMSGKAYLLGLRESTVVFRKEV